MLSSNDITITLSFAFSLLTKLMAAFWMSSRRKLVELLVSIKSTTVKGESVVAK
jgi:hypothetical protein